MSQSKQKIIQWYEDHESIILDEYELYITSCKDKFKEHKMIFHSAIKNEAYNNFKNKLIDQCSFNLALPYDECHDVIEELLYLEDYYD